MKRTIIISIFVLTFSVLWAQDFPQYAPQQAIIYISRPVFEQLTYQTEHQPFITTSSSELNRTFARLMVWKMESLLLEGERMQLGMSNLLSRCFVIYFSSKEPMAQILFQLRSNPAIEQAHPNHLYVVDVIPNDPYYNLQWNLPQIKMPSAWDITKGNGDTRIAILDVGFKLDHEDLNSKFSSLYRRDETDIDTSAYISDGFTLIEGEDYTTPDNDPTSKGRHGTHVAGIAAAATNNNKGIAGVAWNSTLVPVRCGFQIIHPIYGNTGLLESDDWIRALNWVRNTSVARVVNMSFGRRYIWGAVPDEEQAISAAISSGIVICASSGNSNEPVGYPARYKDVIGIGATDNLDQRADFSNYGDSLDLVAPGVDIYSAYFDSNNNSTYDYKSGTSMAAPHVAGAAALILSA